MKSKIITIALILGGYFLAAQVPNTTTFNLQDVENAIPGTQGNLQQCFTDAVSDYFDPAYSGSKNSLLNFRNYGSCYSYVSSGSFTSLTNANSMTISYPAVNANDIIFVIAGHYSNSTMSISGWSSMTISYSTYRLTLFYKHFTASDAGGSLSITSPDFATKFATVHRVKGKSSFTLSQKAALLVLPTGSYTTDETVNGDACEMALAFSALFISQSFSITAGSGWTVRQNANRSGIGALATISYNFNSTSNAPSNTYGFIGQVPFGYISVVLE